MNINAMKQQHKIVATLYIILNGASSETFITFHTSTNKKVYWSIIMFSIHKIK